MKRILVFIVVGLVMFGIGFGGGVVIGRSMANDDTASGDHRRAVPPPGPIVPIGEFTSNLAGSGRHVISFNVSMETVNVRGAEILNNAGWLSRIRNEILLVVKDKVYEDLTSAEGVQGLATEIKTAVNHQLPDIRGEAPVVSVLFESFVLQ